MCFDCGLMCTFSCRNVSSPSPQKVMASPNSCPGDRKVLTEAANPQGVPAGTVETCDINDDTTLS
jgi:hypothetical protein